MSDIKAVILAAGKGTRMKSELPKVLHKVNDKSMVEYVIDSVRNAGADDICVIVGYKGELVRECIEKKDVTFAVQEEQLGTGHAVKCASDFIGTEGSVIILCGDTPLITADTLQKLIAKHKADRNGVTVLSAILDDPAGYGRIIRDKDGDFSRIVEQKDCTSDEASVREINSGMYIFEAADLYNALGKLKNDNVQGEYYLTDTIELIREAGGLVDAMPVDDTDEILGVNTLEQLAVAEEIVKNRAKG